MTSRAFLKYPACFNLTFHMRFSSFGAGRRPEISPIHTRCKDMDILASLVFQRWRWLGKWSDLGRDSRLSGSLIGSPSVIRSGKIELINAKAFHAYRPTFQPCAFYTTAPLNKKLFRTKDLFKRIPSLRRPYIESFIILY